MSFYNVLKEYSWEEVTASIYSKNELDVERALSGSYRTLDDLKSLLSPAADSYLEEMARQSYAVTRQRFGNIIQLYIPLYLSSYCENSCVYCGFSGSNPIKRKVLSMDELSKEADNIAAMPFKHILLVTGESQKHAGVDYFCNAIDTLKSRFSQISLEVQPLDQYEYELLVEKGLHAVYIYQETYNRERYPLYHPKGKKADFIYRLETPDRLGKAGVRKIGLGNLIGLEDWRTEAWFTALHLQYLRRRYWQTKYSISFPRLRPFTGEGFKPNVNSTERDLTQLICAYRLFDNEVELSLSTRERPYYRDNALLLGVTAVSAGSKTNPGGYSESDSLEQFAINDDRSPFKIANIIKSRELEPVWKDWSIYLQHI
ncbi:2-iminoacetate synthase ThiH [Marinilabiliaceae bacterium ANBcel2]|nr:2-iminoacetate synthase ThiH [Marinilabiliaceae bacterium ANBcel2]